MSEVEKSSEAAFAQTDFTVGIYQNSEHIAGLLQQLFAAPLVVGESRESGADKTSGKTKQKGIKGEGSGGGGFSAVARLGLGLAGEAQWSDAEGLVTGTKTTQDFIYSQAYYLFVVYQALVERQLLRPITSAADAKDLRPGDFVEFQASFRPNALHSLLDVLTPELVAAATEYQVKRKQLKLFEAIETFEKQRILSEQMQVKASTHADMARAIAEAIRVDFRATKTREFYGTINDVTAITICDAPHFNVEDEDRILDGSYTVLGKVTSPVEKDLPVLSRNKVLERLGPELVDSLFKLLRDTANEKTQGFGLGEEEFTIDEVFDLALPSRIEGPSFKVIPIAIYV